MNKIEYLTLPIELKSAKDDGDNGYIEGYAAAFNNVDFGFDVIDKGAFKATIKSNKGVWPILADHDPVNQIGWNEKASEDESGLFVVSKLELGVQKASEKYLLAKAAIKVVARMGMSIGYATIKAIQDETNPRIRRLKELKMYEHSLVTFPMNADALVTAAKSLGALDKAKAILAELKAQDISIKDLENALLLEAAKVDEDPQKILQSLDNLILKFKS